MPTLYIANGIGFGQKSRETWLRDVVSTVRTMGFDVIEPFNDNNEVSLAQDRTVSQELEIARLDAKGVRDSDGVLCIISSPIPDEGSMIEVGMAMAWNKPVFYLNDDFRFEPNGRVLPMNLMLFTNTTANTWQEYYYTSLSSLSDPKKAMCKLLHHAVE